MTWKTVPIVHQVVQTRHDYPSLIHKFTICTPYFRAHAYMFVGEVYDLILTSEWHAEIMCGLSCFHTCEQNSKGNH